MQHPVSCFTLALMCSALPTCCWSADDPPPDLKTTLSDYLVEDGAGEVTAASLLGLSGDAITPVETGRGLVAALKGWGSAATAAGIAISPARSSLLPMDLSTYAKGLPYRLLGNLSISVAQGNTRLDGQDYEALAASMAAGAPWHEDDDVHVATVKQCDLAFPIVRPDEDLPADFEATYAACVKRVTAELTASRTLEGRWNISRLSLSMGGGSLKRTDGIRGSLGYTFAMATSYGFEHVNADWLKRHAQLTLALKHTQHASVLNTLGTADETHRNTTIAALRLAGGSRDWRVLAEVSNAHARDREATAERLFRHAVGLERRISEGMWIGFRLGRRQSLNGNGRETASMMAFSYSPKMKP